MSAVPKLTLEDLGDDVVDELARRIAAHLAPHLGLERAAAPSYQAPVQATVRRRRVRLDVAPTTDELNEIAADARRVGFRVRAPR